jgi:hypothetical protein
LPLEIKELVLTARKQKDLKDIKLMDKNEWSYFLDFFGQVLIKIEYCGVIST